MRILIIEDEKDLVMVLSEMLKIEGYYVDAVYDGTSGLDKALSGIYDLIILDVMLPKMNGIKVLEEIRKSNSDMPILMLTAKSEIEDKICGLDNGADDYITKPFNMKELFARIRALLRRREKKFVDDNIKFADIILDKSTHEIHKNENKVKLTKKEYSILEMLIMNNGNVVSKENIMIKIWGYDADVEYNSIEVYISFLRKKIDAVGSEIKIKAVRGLGYALKG